MTGTYSIEGASTIQIERIRDIVLDDPSVLERFGLRVDEPKVRRKRKDAYVRAVVPDKRRFRNQLSVKHGGKSAKIFYNGSLHVTGCASPKDFLDVATRIARFVTDVMSDTTPEFLIRLESFDIKMINAGTVIVDAETGFPMKFPPRTLSVVASAAGTEVDFDSERHPGVKFPIRTADRGKVATVCVFQTGSMSIIGARTPRDVATAFERVVHTLGAASHIGTVVRSMRTTTAKKAFELTHGYLAAMYECCETVRETVRETVCETA